MSDEQRQRQRLDLSRHAVRLFAEQGVAATSGEQIAQAAGVSERTFWRYFPHKESCVEPLLTKMVDAFCAVLHDWPRELELIDHLREAYSPLLDAATDEDIEAEYERIAVQVNQKVNQVRKAYEKNDAVDDLKAQMRKSKALDWLLEHVEIVDTNGAPIDRAELLGEGYHVHGDHVHFGEDGHDHDHGDHDHDHDGHDHDHDEDNA